MQPGIGHSELTALCATAVAIGAGHTILGPDHYVPFAAMSRAGRWSAFRTAAVTAACGLGHVAGSVVIGLVGLATGTAITRIEGLEGLRGDIAAWLLVAFGLAYAAWGAIRANRHIEHQILTFGMETDRVLSDGQDAELLHARQPAGTRPGVWGPWSLFLVFLFGPCEPLIPLLMYPAATLSPITVAAVALAFAAATLVTMVAAVLALGAGFGMIRASRFERHGHTMAGLTVAACGLLVVAGL